MCRFPSHRALATVSTAALQKNFTLLDSLVARHGEGPRPPRTIAVVKANAYGHGAELVVPALLASGCSFFAVATPDEAHTVRKLAPNADILILGYTPPSLAPDLINEGLIQTVFSSDYAKELEENTKATKNSLKIHLKIDGGMCRLGFLPENIVELNEVSAHPHLRTVGIYTHFPCADTDPDGTRHAFWRFLRCRQTLSDHGLSLFSHAAASAALLTAPETALNGARVGLALYGISPVATSLPLSPALTLTAPVVQIHEVEAGTPVGYGGQFVSERPSKIGTLPIGYADGIPRHFKNTVGGVRILTEKGAFFAPIAGNICMDQMMIDLTSTPTRLGDRAVFFDDIKKTAQAMNTIPYEILTGIGTRVLRMGSI